MKVKNIKIKGYDMQAFICDDGYTSIRLPYGKTPLEIKMFDNITYHNKHIYHAKNETLAIMQIEAFICGYKG